jgi:hypothetical protein
MAEPSPLLKKLGIKDSHRVCFIGAPEDVLKKIKVPKKVEVAKKLSGACDYIHIFAKDPVKLERSFRDARVYIKMNGMIWISWPKQSSGVKTDLNENSIRDLGINFGLVDVKVVAIDDIWSGLKFVYKLSKR